MRSLERAHIALAERCLGPGRRQSLKVTAYKVWSFPSGEWEMVSHYTSDISSMKVVVTPLEALVLNPGPSHNQTQTYFSVQKKKQNPSFNVLKGNCSLEGHCGKQRWGGNEVSFI